MGKEGPPKINLESKKEINTGNGAAVFVGTKEKVEEAKEIMETEGVKENLETFIRFHKEIIVPKEKLADFLDGRRTGKPRPGCYKLLGNDFTFIDKEGNVARVAIDTTKIEDRKPTQLDEKIEELGFRRESPLGGVEGKDWEIVFNAVGWYRRELAENQKTENKKEFDF
jgi:hypothetical protein